MTNILSLSVIAAVCVVVAGNAEEEGANTHVLLGEFDLDDQCHRIGETEWTFLTRSDHPDTSVLQQSKIEEEQTYGDKARSLAEEVAPYMEQQFGDPKLNDKLLIFSTAGDVLLDKEYYEKEVMFSNSLQQIAREYRNCTKPPCQLAVLDVQHALATSKEPEKLLCTWTEYQRRFSSKIDEYLEILQLAKVAAEANGAEEVETYWEQQSEFYGGYTKALFLWKSIEPLYQKLCTFMSKQLSRHYIFLRSTNDTVIPAHLLGTVAGNDWTYIADHVLHSRTYRDMLSLMRKKVLGGMNVYKTAENMLAKLGLGRLPPKFWEQSWFNSSCPAHVVNYCNNGEARVLTCNITGWAEYMDAYETAMRIKHIQLAEENTFILRDNSHYSAIYEAVTGLSALLATSPEYLQELGLLKSNHKQKKSAQLSRASLLLLVALRTLPKLPYYLAADLWRLEALSGNLTNITDLNALWRRYRTDMQMISVPSGDETIFDFLSDPYITSNKPYLGKFCGLILQFQLLQRLTEGADVERCEGDADVCTSSEDLNDSSLAFGTLLQSGKSRKWPDLLAEVLGINDLDSGPLLQYFQKLESYLEELGRLEPIKPSRHVVRSTSTPLPTSDAEILYESSNDTDSAVNSTNASVKQNSDSSEQQSKYGTGTIVLFACGALTAVVVVVGIVMVHHQCLGKYHIYSQATTRES